MIPSSSSMWARCGAEVERDGLVRVAVAGEWNRRAWLTWLMLAGGEGVWCGVHVRVSCYLVSRPVTGLLVAGSGRPARWVQTCGAPAVVGQAASLTARTSAAVNCGMGITRPRVGWLPLMHSRGLP